MDSATVGVRLNRDVWNRYSGEAQARGLALGTYLRQRLEHADGVGAELTALRAAVERATIAPPAGPGPLCAAPDGVLVEVLLLLRSLVGPQKAAVAQKEVERRGLEVWR